MRKKTAKRLTTTEHREYVYTEVLFGVLDGRYPPEYATKRWLKVKQIKGGK